KVAHNSIIAKPDHERIKELTLDLKDKLEEALLKLPQVSVPQEERELVAENAASNINAIFGEFILAWRVLEGQLYRISHKKSIPRTLTNRQILELLQTQGDIDTEIYKRVLALQIFRNRIMHDPGFNIPEEEMRVKIMDILYLADILGRIDGNSLNDE
ncbi:MAG TPA: hypothetical protein VEF04_17745, partial [Blastocatellia bacterium]|nr:hypothetical protein [Blastocatellia bacterium]